MGGTLTVTEVAALLRTHSWVITRMCRRGVLPAIKVGREWRISETHVRSMANVIA
jgi:excisionase family DNA binding protein